MTRIASFDSFLLQKKHTTQYFVPLQNVFLLTFLCLLCILTCLAPFSTKSYGAEALVLEDQREILGLPTTPRQPTITNKKTTKTRATRTRKTSTFSSSTISTSADNAFDNADDGANDDLASDDLASDDLARDVESQELPISINTSSSANATSVGTIDTPQKSVVSKSIRLFNTVEFRGPLKNIPKWASVLAREKKQLTFYNGAVHPQVSENVKKQWLHLRSNLEHVSPVEKIKSVNRFFNQWPYKTDLVAWGVEDYWATPQEFLRKSGDCEDYAIAKYYALRDLGLPASQLRIVALIETIRNIGHAVLVVFIDNKAYVLDNLSNVIVQHNQLPHYNPKFSVNEEYRWVHVHPVKRGRK